MTDDTSIKIMLIEFFKKNKVRPIQAMRVMKNIIADFDNIPNEKQNYCIGVVEDNTDYGDEE